MDGEFESMDSSCEKENNENKEHKEHQKKLENLYRKLARMLNLTGTCYWVYDGDEIVEQRKFNTMLASSWTNGVSIDEPIQIDISGLKYYYHANSLGSIYAMTDSTGAVVERYEYDSYGKVTIYDPTLTVVRTYSIAGNFSLFTGRQLDYETGLYYYRARMYDANTGRFLSHDPMGYIDGVNLYQYVKSNPITFSDPYGNYTEKEVNQWVDDLIGMIGRYKNGNSERGIARQLAAISEALYAPCGKPANRNLLNTLNNIALGSTDLSKDENGKPVNAQGFLKLLQKHVSLMASLKLTDSGDTKAARLLNILADDTIPLDQKGALIKKEVVKVQ